MNYFSALSRKPRGRFTLKDYIVTWLLSHDWLLGPRPWFDNHYYGEWCECIFRHGCRHRKRRPGWARNPSTGTCCGCGKTDCDGYCTHRKEGIKI